MTLPSSPPLTLTQVLAAFSAPAGTPLTAMVRGGAYVPNTSQNANIPTAAPLNLLNFLGVSSTPPVSTTTSVKITNQSISGYAYSSTTPPNTSAFARYMLLNNGTAYVSTSQSGGSYYISGEWLVSGAPADCEARATLLEGALSEGTLNTWLELGASRVWGVYDYTYGGAPATCRLLIEIRSRATQQVLGSAQITLTAELEYLDPWGR